MPKRKCIKIEKTKNFERCRKIDPKVFDKKSFRVKTFKTGTKIILGCKKGMWNPKSRRCKVNLKVQSVLKPI